MTRELIVRRLSATFSNAATITVGNDESGNNIARFFNDTPWDLSLVAIKMTVYPSMVGLFTEVNREDQRAVIAELSRQAIFGQQEGILASVTASYVSIAIDYAAGAGLSHNKNSNVGQAVFGDYKTEMMVQETETNLFLNAQIRNLLDSTNSLAPGDANAHCEAIMYYNAKGRR